MMGGRYEGGIDNSTISRRLDGHPTPHSPEPRGNHLNVRQACGPFSLRSRWRTGVMSLPCRQIRQNDGPALGDTDGSTSPPHLTIH